jgi:hypothetical protein
VKLLNFNSYDIESKDDMDRAPAVARAWTIAILAAQNAPAGKSAGETARAVRVYDKIRSLAVREGDNRRLNPTGGSLVFEHEELESLKASVDLFRANVMAGQADALVFLDELIANAPEQAKAIN